MKHYIDIEVLRDFDTNIGEIHRERNDKGFEPGDIVSVTEKIDGANASICIGEDGNLEAYSRKQPLTPFNTLNGFYGFAMTLDKTAFAAHPTYIVFGEWMGARNKIIYNEETMKKWIVYSIFNSETETWLPPAEVKAFCKEAGLTYIHEFYYGPFKSWDHIREFLQNPQYGARQEGVVIRDVSKMNDPGSRLPFILKIVNEDFKESQRQKIVDPAKETAKMNARALMETIVTENRVTKELFKMRDEGLIPDNFDSSHFAVIAKNLPKRIFADCMKEEADIVTACGEYAGKACSSITMEIVRGLFSNN